MNKDARYRNQENEYLLKNLGNLMHTMREEVGLGNVNISVRDSLSLIINNAHDKKNDKYFE